MSVIAITLLLLAIWYGFKNMQLTRWLSPASLSLQHATAAIVMPHHDLLIEEFPLFYSQIQTTKPIKKIIFLSPNHFEPESLVAKTTHSFFTLPDSQQIAVVANSSSLFPDKVVINDPDIFKNEHGVLLHLPFIKKYFPDAEVLPLLVTRNISKNNLKQIVGSLKPIITDETLIIVSTDFSHYLKKVEAEEKDSETIALIEENNYEQIATLNDDYLDCPICMNIVMQLVGTSLKPEVLFHSNSTQYLNQTKDEPVTSYFVIRW